MIFPEIAKEILQELKNAESQGNPITLKEALENWGNGSTWKDIVDRGYISRLPKAVTVTSSGLKWLEEQ